MKKRLLLAALSVVAASMLLVACGGSKTDLPALATEAANVQPQEDVTVVAKNLKFNTNTIVVPAGQQLSITLDNQDSGTLHNISVYTSESSDHQAIYKGELFKGKNQETYTFTAPAPGVYYFRCDAHPDMNGAFVVK